MSTFRIAVLSFLAATFIRILRRTWRVRVVTESPLPNDRRRIYCFWHGNQAALFAYRQSRPIVVLSSLSQDGTLQAGILARLGYVVRRGSSSRSGAAGLKAMIRCIREGCDGAFAVDGPRGPYHRAKPGAMEAAKQSGALIVPVSSRASGVWVFQHSWDKYALPKPFATVTIRLGKSLHAADVSVNQLTALIDRPFHPLNGRNE